MKTVLELEHVCKSYFLMEETEQLLDDLSFRLEAQQSCLVRSPTAAKLLALQSIVALLERPTSGTHLFLGQNVAQMSDHQMDCVRARAIGTLGADRGIIPHMTVLENIALPALMLDGDAGAAERRAAAAEFLDEFSLQDKALLRCRDLNEEERCRVVFLREYLKEPPLLLVHKFPLASPALCALMRKYLFRYQESGGAVLHFDESLCRLCPPQQTLVLPE